MRTAKVKVGLAGWCLAGLGCCLLVLGVVAGNDLAVGAGAGCLTVVAVAWAVGPRRLTDVPPALPATLFLPTRGVPVVPVWRDAQGRTWRVTWASPTVVTPGAQRVEWNVPRGTAEVSASWVMSDGLRLTRSVLRIDRPLRVVIHPAIGPIGASDQRDLLTDAQDEVVGSRPWRAGDARRDVNWRASARTTVLMARERAHQRREALSFALFGSELTDASLSVLGAKVEGAMAGSESVTIHSPAGPYTVLDGQDLRWWLAQADESRVFKERTADREDVEWIDAALTNSEPTQNAHPPVSTQGLNVVAALGIASAVVTHPELWVAGFLAIFAVMVGARSRRIGLPVLAAALLFIVVTAGFTAEALLALTSWTMAVLAAWGVFSTQAAWLSRCSAVLPLGTALVNPVVTVPSTVAVPLAAATVVWVFARKGDANRTSSGALAAACAVAIMLGAIVAPNVVTALDGIDAAGSPPATRTATFSAGALDLSARGPLPETALWTVPDSGPQLWRSAVYDTYDGQWWTNIPDLPQQPTTIDLQLADVGGTDEVKTSPTTAAVIGSPAALGTPGVSPGIPLSIVTEGDVIPDATGSFFVQPDPLGDGLIRYTVTGLEPPTAAEDPSTSTTALPNVARWEQLPPLTPRVQDIAAQLRRPSPQQTANAVSDYLRQNLTYTLDSPRPAEGQDAVDHTLFEARSGFCEQFSTAQVVLLRANGIPARLVTGFSGGQANGVTRTLHGVDAHAWVEYWDDTNGWLTTDPTAGATQASGVTGADLRPYTIAGLLLPVGMAAWFLRRLRARRRSRTHDREAAPLLDAFHALEQRAAGQGIPRHPGETIKRFGQRLNPNDPALFNLVEQTAYGVDPPSLDAQSDAADELGALLAGGSR